MKKFTFDVKKTVSYWVGGGEYVIAVGVPAKVINRIQSTDYAD